MVKSVIFDLSRFLEFADGARVLGADERGRMVRARGECGSSNDGGIENDALLLSMSIRHLEFEGFHFARVGGGDVWYESNTTNDENERN